MHQIIKSDDSGVRLDRWLKENLSDVTYIEVQKLIRTGQVRIDGGRKKSNYRLNSGEKIWFPPRYTKINSSINKKIQHHGSLSIEKITIYEDESLLVLDKPYGLSTQGGTGVKYHIDQLLSEENEDVEKNYRLVHRLDKYTSGALIIAKRRDSASFYTKAFLDKKIKKCYLALTAGEFKKKIGVIDLPLKKTNLKQASISEDKFQDAITQYEVIATTKNKISLVKLEPITGRKHQIRKHLSMLNSPIIGDAKYGNNFIPNNIEKRFYLHSFIIEFPAYNQQQNITVRAKIPQYFDDALKALGVEFDE